MQAVWDAWTDPAQTAQWWGPRGFTLTTHSKDLRPGGNWSYTMHGPDGTDYPNESVFKELDAPRRVVLEHIVAPHFVLGIDLIEEADGKTLVQWQQTFDSAQVRESLAVIVGPANEQNLDRWEAEVHKVVAP